MTGLDKEAKKGLNKRRKPRDPKAKRSYILCSDGVLFCYKNPADDCKIRLVQASVLSDFHDEHLQRVTDEINAVLDRTEKANKDQSKYLSVLRTPKGLFLAWTVEGIGSSDEDEDKVCRCLGI